MMPTRIFSVAMMLFHSSQLLYGVELRERREAGRLERGRPREQGHQ
jgi:hypothetical protein